MYCHLTYHIYRHTHGYDNLLMAFGIWVGTNRKYQKGDKYEVEHLQISGQMVHWESLLDFSFFLASLVERWRSLTSSSSFSTSSISAESLSWYEVAGESLRSNYIGKIYPHLLLPMLD